MKKVYLLAFAMTGMFLSSNAQIINDDMESYPFGPLENDHWTTWTAGAEAERIIIVDTYAHSGFQSGMIGDDSTQDAILKLGGESSGEFTVSWYNYVPAGKSGYYNFQENEDPGAGAWAINVYYNYINENPATGWIVDDQNPANVVAAFDYPEDTWFKITHHIDLDADTVVILLDGNEVYNGPFYSGSNLGSVDFYSAPVEAGGDNFNELYIDDVVYAEGFLGKEDFTVDNFSIYPNPVTDILNISTKVAVDQVIVYDILGKVVLSSQPVTISPKVDMSALASGAYMVKVSIGNTSKTVKVIK